MIQLQCESCGKSVRAPSEAAGKQAKCPSCGHTIYIPSPQEEVEELPLAPEDTDFFQREAALLEERRRLDRILSREDRTPPERSAPSRPAAAQNEPVGLSAGADAEMLVIDYLCAMRDSDFDRAQESLAGLRRHRTEARQVIDRLAADQIPPPQMTRVPPAVYQGFLKNLRIQL